MNAKLNLLSIALVLGTLAGCSSTPMKEAAAPAESVATAAPAAPAPMAPPAESAVAKVTIPDHLDPNSAIRRDHSVFFEFDKYTIQSNYVAVVDRHAKYLVAHPSLSIKIEGNADERGGREYNLALGQKRADAVKQALKLAGVKEDQMESVSFGKEKPVALGHDEAAWSQNRRADIAYPSK
jgi:peptidoglycan-associated lipoprotein